MPILNYTTKVSPEKTVAEIVGILSRKGVLSISHLFTEGKLSGVSFVMRVGDESVPFLLPVKVEGVKAVLLKHRRGPMTGTARRQLDEQAPRTAWRILKDWVEAQIALVESNQVEIAQVFLPYAKHGDRTVYEIFVEQNQKQLKAGDRSDLLFGDGGQS